MVPTISSSVRSSSPTSVAQRHLSVDYRGVIFDLDGTLVDSTDTLVGATNYALAKLGFPTFSKEEVRPMLGGGTKKLVRSALFKALGHEPSDELLAKASAFKLEFESTPEGMNSKVPFPHVMPMLRRLQDAGIQMAVLSNTREPNVRKIVSKYFDEIDWIHVAGARDGTPLKPHPFAALRIAKEYMRDLMPHDVAFVGDSEFDMKTAKDAEMTPLAVPWGIRDVEKLVDNGAFAVAGTMHDVAQFVLGGEDEDFSRGFRVL